MSNITLFCLMQGDDPGNIFEVEIENDKYISDLKEEIEKKKPGVDFDKLRKVNIPLENNDKVFNTQPCSDVKEFECEELDETKKVADYFSNELTEKNIIILHIIIQCKPLNVVLFGLAGHGKSSMANMLIQGDIKQENNVFEVNDGAVGETENMQGSINEIFQVFDTVGLGEPSSGSVPHDKAVKKIRNYFSQCDLHLNYIFYVKKKGRFTNEDVEMFKIFKKLFQGGEKNFVIIITHSKQGWVDKHLDIIKKNFGNYPIIPVDFPYNDEDEDDEEAQLNEKLRLQSLRNLLKKLFELNYKGVKLEILNSSQKTEDNVAKVIDFVPFVGSAYQLISAGVYYKLGKPNAARDRFISGAAGLAFDVMTLGTVAAVSKKAVGKAVTSTLGKAIAGNVAQRISMKVVEESSEITAKETKNKKETKSPKFDIELEPIA